jgi:mRNA interferase MazF
MARRVARGDVWTYALRPPDKERPVLVLTRDAVIDLLDTVMVAPVTSTVRGIPSEVLVGREEGLDHDSAVNLDHVQTVPKSRLGRRLGRLAPGRMGEVCTALATAVACGG